ncbi:hypothetical protein X738_29960 [Mesorhizobium sp. LNHC209A00]|nr:hypothetical protein X738_29960 [Mesorhizobium sp. LNHC209A00]
MALLLRRDDDLTGADPSIERPLDSAERRRMAERCHEIVWTNGADATVQFIEEHAIGAKRKPSDSGTTQC